MTARESWPSNHSSFIGISTNTLAKICIWKYIFFLIFGQLLEANALRDSIVTIDSNHSITKLCSGNWHKLDKVTSYWIEQKKYSTHFWQYFYDFHWKQKIKRDWERSEDSLEMQKASSQNRRVSRSAAIWTSSAAENAKSWVALRTTHG